MTASAEDALRVQALTNQVTAAGTKHCSGHQAARRTSLESKVYKPPTKSQLQRPRKTLSSTGSLAFGIIILHLALLA
jgi:hypothetical protein